MKYLFIKQLCHALIHKYTFNTYVISFPRFSVKTAPAIPNTRPTTALLSNGVLNFINTFFVDGVSIRVQNFGGAFE